MLVRLTHAMVLLDFHAWRQQQTLQRAKKTGLKPVFRGSDLLDEVEEQCRQILLGWQEMPRTDVASTRGEEYIVYTALAYVMRVFTQRAINARLSGYIDTAVRERYLGLYICQRTFNALQDEMALSILISEIVLRNWSEVSYWSPVLPPLPDFTLQQGDAAAEGQQSNESLLVEAEVTFAFAEISEEVAAHIEREEEAQELYGPVDHAFELALNAYQRYYLREKHDHGVVARAYQRYAFVLERRAMMREDSVVKVEKQLGRLLKDVLGSFAYPFSLDEEEE
jgi:hypothetical protein